MKLKNLALGALAAVLFSTLVMTPALANPPEGAVTENTRKTIVRDPLGPTGVDPDALGWVTFACESVEGFQYSVSVKGLVPNATYTLEAISLPSAWTPFGVLPSSDFPAGALYPLGTIHTNGKGEGKLNEGLLPLPATHLFLPFGLYEFVVVVKDSSGTAVLDGWIDPNGFQVFSSWP